MLWVDFFSVDKSLTERHLLLALVGSSPHLEEAGMAREGSLAEVQLQLLFPQDACWTS